MPCGRYGLLLYKYFSTYRALRAGSQSILFAGSRYGRQFLGLMAQSRNDRLFLDHGTANHTTGFVGETVLCAGGCNVFHLLNLMTKRGNYLLRGQHLTTYSAMGTSSFSFLGAGSIHRFVHDLLMPKRGNHFRAGQYFTADCAARSCSTPFLGTGGFHFRNLLLHMSGSRHSLFDTVTTQSAFQRNLSILCACGFFDNCFHVVMTGLNQISQSCLRNGKFPSASCILQ